MLDYCQKRMGKSQCVFVIICIGQNFRFHVRKYGPFEDWQCKVIVTFISSQGVTVSLQNWGLKVHVIPAAMK